VDRDTQSERVKFFGRGSQCLKKDKNGEQREKARRGGNKVTTDEWGVSGTEETQSLYRGLKLIIGRKDEIGD